MESYKKDNEEKVKIQPKDQWLENIKSRNDVNSEFEAKALKAKKIDMSSLDYVKLPEKMNVVGQPGAVSVKCDKKVRGANRIHGVGGTDFRV